MPPRNASLRDLVSPGISNRAEFPLRAKKSALLIIDVQQYLSNPENAADAAEKTYFYEEALPRAVGNIIKLAQAFRVIRDDPETFDEPTGCEVIFTYLQSATLTGRDTSLDYKLSGSKLAHIPRSDCKPEDLFLESCKPDQTTGKGDILLPKTSCSVFCSTNLDYLLRNLGVEQLVIAGQLTDQCVESAVRDAADLGYFVTVTEDACAAMTPDDHLRGLEGAKGFCRILETGQVMDEILEDLASGMKSTKLHHARHQGPPEQQPLTDDTVLAYLRDKGLAGAADQLKKLFGQKNKSEDM
jgi:nicotinamidase-related amidase